VTKTPDPTQENDSAQYAAGVYLIATPIGNLNDITLRALEALKACDIVYCEDTRVSGKLLNHYGIKKPLRSLHDHNEDGRAAEIVAAVAAGQRIGVISDAGMPLISDPGYKVVSACITADIPITSLPGANSPLMALQLSGLPSDRFLFLGFVPTKSKARREIFAPFQDMGITLIYFESAQRLVESLKDIQAVFGEANVAVCRELTKFYEEIKRDKVNNLINTLEQAPIKGEVVVVVHAPAADKNVDDIDALLRSALQHSSLRDAVDQVIAATGLPRNVIYPRALALRDNAE
jgi:16S rRNA (cytidine1402-2'-O)-methyltransferase